MSDKIIARRISKDGTELHTENLSESEQENVEAAWNDGERDPGTLRELI